MLVGDSEEKLQRLVSEFANVCWRRKLTVNVGKSKTMRINGNENEREIDISMNGAQMEMAESYKCLGVNVTCDGRYPEGINLRTRKALSERRPPPCPTILSESNRPTYCDLATV